MTDYENIFLAGLESRDRQIIQRMLQRIFPRTEAVWSNVYRTDTDSWQRDRLVCSRAHFPTYFAFSVHDEAVAAFEVEQVLTSAGNADQITALFRRFVSQPRRRGGTRAALVLEELRIRSSEVADGNIGSLLRGLFMAADDLDVEVDEAGGFDIGSNNLRIHWLINDLVRDRFEENRRSEFIEEACQTASLGWLIDISRRCNGDYAPRDDQEDPRDPLVSHDVATRLSTLSRQRLREAADNGSLAGNRRLLRLLYQWSDLEDDATVRAWTDAQLDNDEFIVTLASRSVQASWSQGLGISGLGDLVARRNEYVNLQPLEPLVDIPRFRERVDEMLDNNGLSDDHKAILEHHKATPEHSTDEIRQARRER